MNFNEIRSTMEGGHTVTYDNFPQRLQPTEAQLQLSQQSERLQQQHQHLQQTQSGNSHLDDVIACVISDAIAYSEKPPAERTLPVLVRKSTSQKSTNSPAESNCVGGGHRMLGGMMGNMTHSNHHHPHHIHQGYPHPQMVHINMAAPFNQTGFNGATSGLPQQVPIGQSAGIMQHSVLSVEDQNSASASAVPTMMTSPASHLMHYNDIQYRPVQQQYSQQTQQQTAASIPHQPGQLQQQVHYVSGSADSTAGLTFASLQMQQHQQAAPVQQQQQQQQHQNAPVYIGMSTSPPTAAMSGQTRLSPPSNNSHQHEVSNVPAAVHRHQLAQHQLTGMMQSFPGSAQSNTGPSGSLPLQPLTRYQTPAAPYHYAPPAQFEWVSPMMQQQCGSTDPNATNTYPRYNYH